MSNAFKLGKKVLTITAAFTTVVTSVFGSAFFALLPAVAASCPTLNPGDMIKVNGKPAIYAINKDSKVLYFPSGDEFKSWNADNKYGGYVTVTQECFDSLQVPASYPGAVNYRPGSFVVKRPSSDQLYVVEPGNTLAKITVDAAKALYGASYKVMTVADPFWPHYVNRGPDVTEALVHPGMLVSNGGKNWYIDGTMKREVTANGFTANRFKTAFVHPVTDAMLAGLTTGDVIDGYVAAISDRTQSGVVAGTTTPGTTAGALTVALASDNPFSATVISDSGTNGAQAMIPVLKLNFTADNSGDVNVTSLKLTRGGVSADTDISNMYLYDGATLLASNPSVANTKVTFSNTAGLFTVSKGTTRTITVKLDLKNAVTAGKTLTFSVASNADVVSASGGSVGGTFPVMGNTFTVAGVTDLGNLTFSNVSPTVAGTVDPGTTGFEIWRFKAVDTNQDMDIRKLTFTVVGSVNQGDLQNFSLWDGATQVGSTVASLSSNKTVTFDLSAAPYVVTKGQTKNFSLKADIVGGTNRTFYASFQNPWDIVTYDRNYGVYVKPSGPNGTDTFTIIQAGGTNSVNWTVNSGTLTQTVASDAPSGNIPDGATSVTLAKFLWKANGENIKVSSLSVSSTGSVTTHKLVNVRLLVNGSQVGTTISSLTANGSSNNGWGTFGNSFIITAGTTATVTVAADTTDASVVAGDTYAVGLSAGSSNAQGTVSLSNVSTVAQTANTLTVRAGTVTVTKNSAFGDKSATNPTGTVNGSQVKVASFVVTAGSGEDVNISQVTLKDNASSPNCIGTYMQNLTLKAGSTQLGQTVANPSTTCTTANTYTFNISPAVKVTNGSQYVIDVYADLKAALTTATALVQVNSVTATGNVTGQDASYNTPAVALQNAYIASAGGLTIQTDPNTPVAVNNLMGATDQVIGSFQVTSTPTEPVNITQLVVSAYFTTGATGTVRNIRLYDDATGAQIGTAAAAFSDSVAGTTYATTTYSHATFSGLNFQIPAGSSKTVDVKADFTPYQDGGFTTTGQTVTPVILNYLGTNTGSTVTANGASSGASITPTISNTNSLSVFPAAQGAYAATSTLYRAKLTTSWASDAPSGASSPSASQTVAKFVVTNLANAGGYTATVNLVNFNFSSTISAASGATMSQAMSVYKDSLSTTALATTYWTYTGTSSGAPYAISGNTLLTTANFTAVPISSGASKTFYVTLDTTAAASTKSLSVRIPSGGITWTDGVTPGLTSMGTDLPLQYKTFTY